MSIVSLQVSRIVAAAPSTRQSTGAVISQGGTTLGNGVYSLLTQASDLTPLLASALALSSLVWSAGTVTATASAAIPGLTTGDTFLTTIASASPSGYDGTFKATVTGANSFTFPLAVNPGSETVPGTYTPPSQAELVAMVADFFAQGSRQAVYVLELGAGDGTSGPPALQNFITANPGFFYAYLCPRSWDGTSAFNALQAQYQGLSSMTYFFATTTTGSYTFYTALMKGVLALVEAPSIPTTEFSFAAAFWKVLSYAPSSTNKLTPLGNSELTDVTPYPTAHNAAVLAALEAANINVIGTGAEGGIPNAILQDGNTLDGNDFGYWYSVDWIQINAHQRAAADVINGANDSVNPLWYDQNGINQLQTGQVAVLRQAVAAALSPGAVTQTAMAQADFLDALEAGDFDGQNVVNAEPLLTYLKENPSDFDAGRYSGITIAYIPARSFKHIVFSVLVTSLVTA